MHAVTGEREFLSEARVLGDQLVGAAVGSETGDGCYWEIASSAPGGPVAPHLGLLHGTAGVGLALAYLGHVTGDETYGDAAQGAAELLITQAVASPAGAAEQRLTWPGHLEDGATGLQAHCHGAGGIGQFLLWLDALLPNPRQRAIAEAAANAIAGQRASETRAGICHGVSGTGHLMLDCHRRLGGAHWLALAADCGGQLRRFRIAEQPGVYAMHDKGAVSPDLMLGYAGAGSFLLRFATAATASDLIFGPLNDAMQNTAARNRRAPVPLHADQAPCTTP